MTDDPLIYADPYSGQEILLLPGDVPSGSAYDPRRTDPPVAWQAGCSHCLGDSRHLSIHVRRQIQLLSSRRVVTLGRRKILEYDVPCCTHKIQHWLEADGSQAALILVPDPAGISATQAPHDRLILNGVIGSKITLRQLKFLFSVRVASSNEILAASSQLASKQLEDRHVRGYRTACRKIDWQSVVDIAKQPPNKRSATERSATERSAAKLAL